MKIPVNARIPDAKLRQYLLIPRQKNDKSAFLAQAGFTLENPEDLDKALRQLISENEAFPDRQNEYGTFFRVEGDLSGPHGILPIVSVWMLPSNEAHYRFVTLKPAR